jgi:hypothetical protein
MRQALQSEMTEKSKTMAADKAAREQQIRDELHQEFESDRKRWQEREQMQTARIEELQRALENHSGIIEPPHRRTDAA